MMHKRVHFKPTPPFVKLDQVNGCHVDSLRYITEYARVAERSKILKGELSDAFIPYQVQCRH
jgi:hypothetical protein